MQSVLAKNIEVHTQKNDTLKVQTGDHSAYNYIKKHIKMFQRFQPTVVELIGVAPFLP